MAGIYIHIPYCRKKCIYCNFFSRGDRNVDWKALAHDILSEWGERKIELEGEEVKTIYLGGGTPSLMPVDELRKIISSVPLEKAEEFTIEVNPDDVDEEKCLAWREMGINRVSMGVQSWKDSDLTFLRRRHDSREAFEAYNLLKKYFRNISIDLIFGLPGQTLEDWKENLDLTFRLRPEHISAYSLTYEEGTPLFLMKEQGRVNEADENAVLAFYSALCEKARNHGYEHYEISNFSLPGRKSRHNSSYWEGIPYLGLGSGAHSYDGKRTRKMRDSEGILQTEHLSNEELREEMILTRLRTSEGLSLKDYEERFGNRERRKLEERGMKLLAEGKLIKMEEGLRISEEFWMEADSIILYLV